MSMMGKTRRKFWKTLLWKIKRTVNKFFWWSEKPSGKLNIKCC